MINYLTGDATVPVTKPAVIAHSCNTWGGWGSGFVVALSDRWPDPELAYRRWHAHGEDDTSGEKFELGAVQFVNVADDIIVANIIGQDGVRGPTNPAPVRYLALNKGILTVAAFCEKMGYSFHSPRLGAGLGGGNWREVEKLILNAKEEHPSVDFYVYDLPSNTAGQ